MEVIMKQLRDRTKAGEAFRGKQGRMRSRGGTGREGARVQGRLSQQLEARAEKRRLYPTAETC